MDYTVWQPVYMELALGFSVIITLSQIADALADSMFGRGWARPFYVKGIRVHHRRVLYVGIPALYVIFAALVVQGYVQLVSASFWQGVGTTLAITSACVILDLLWDGLSERTSKSAILHHEWLYLAIPAYIFTFFLRLSI
jgi:hypothetical protein